MKEKAISLICTERTKRVCRELEKRCTECYRFGFNGKENDKEINNGTQDFGARIYDGRISRFLSTDPLMNLFSSQSPYLYAYNSPIELIDVDGLYGDKSEATKQRASAMALGYHTGELYQSGDEWGFNVLSGEDGSSSFDYNYVSLHNVIIGGLIIGEIMGENAFHEDIIYAREELGASVAEAGLFALWREKLGGGGLTRLGGTKKGGGKISTLSLKKPPGKRFFADIVKDVKKTIVKTDGKSIVSSTSGNKIDPKTQQKVTGSGKPAVHTVKKTTIKQTKEAAKYDQSNGSNKKAVFHNKDAKGGHHYHNAKNVGGKGKETKGYGKKSGKVSNNLHYSKRGDKH